MNSHPISKLQNHELENKSEQELLRQKEIEEYRKRAMQQWFEDSSCTGGDLRKENNDDTDTE